MSPPSVSQLFRIQWTLPRKDKIVWRFLRFVPVGHFLARILVFGKMLNKIPRKTWFPAPPTIYSKLFLTVGAFSFIDLFSPQQRNCLSKFQHGNCLPPVGQNRTQACFFSDIATEQNDRIHFYRKTYLQLSKPLKQNFPLWNITIFSKINYVERSEMQCFETLIEGRQLMISEWLLSPVKFKSEEKNGLKLLSPLVVSCKNNIASSYMT